MSSYWHKDTSFFVNYFISTVSILSLLMFLVFLHFVYLKDYNFLSLNNQKTFFTWVFRRAGSRVLIFTLSFLSENYQRRSIQNLKFKTWEPENFFPFSSPSSASLPRGFSELNFLFQTLKLMNENFHFHLVWALNLL